jgi:hypothetical protein
MILQRPLFHQQSLVDQLAADITVLVRILERLPEQCFADSYACLRAQGVSTRAADLVLNGCVGDLFTHVRADVIQSAGVFKVIEINFGSGIGGIEVSKINRALMAEERFAAFARHAGISYTDTPKAIADQLCEVSWNVVGTKTPTVAIVLPTGSSYSVSSVVEELRRQGVEALYAELKDVTEWQEKIYLRDETPVDLVFRYFFTKDLLEDPEGTSMLQMFARAHKVGKTAFFTSLDDDLYGRKTALAFLREPEIWATLSAAEQAVVDRRVPWTRLLGTDYGTVSNVRRQDLMRECISRKDELVLKPGDGTGSIGVVFGSDTPGLLWRQLVMSKQATNYVVQDRVIPDDEIIVDPDTGIREPWQIVWGVFVTDTGYAGTFTRGRRSADNGIIDGPGEHTRPGCAFTY